jgi:hypothetical protein
MERLLVATAIALVSMLAAPAHADPAVPAIWRVQQLPFTYYSARTAYSCSGLQEKIRSILQAVGAHEPVIVEIDCPAGELLRSARASISIATPIEATDENIRAATSFEPYEIMAARLRGVALPTATNIERFVASWRRISLSHLQLRMGDCDLLKDLRAQVFPRLRLRNASGFGCSTTATRVRPVPKVEALIHAGTVAATAQTAS